MYRPLFCFVLLLLSPLTACARPAQAPSAPNPGRPHFTLLTFNVNYGLRDAPQNLRAIVDADADVVLLQEATPALERATLRLMKTLYPHQQYRYCCGAGGLGVLSKHPFEDVNYIDSPIGWFPGWWVRVDTPAGPVQVLSVHLRPPVSDGGSWVKGYFTTGPLRLKELAAYMAKREAGVPTIVAGDFNETRGAAMDLLRGAGLDDAVAAFHSGDAVTWRWRTRVGDIELALDHVFHDDGLRARNAEVLDAGASDHLPVKVLFEQGTAARDPAQRRARSLRIPAATRSGASSWR
jgi:vancomycin resistance protein VanJ